MKPRASSFREKNCNYMQIVNMQLNSEETVFQIYFSSFNFYRCMKIFANKGRNFTALHDMQN